MENNSVLIDYQDVMELIELIESEAIRIGDDEDTKEFIITPYFSL